MSFCWMWRFPPNLPRRSAVRATASTVSASRVGAFGRALTCSALKPQGVPPARLAQLAEQFARGGIDFIKDDHGLADQAYSPFAERVAAVAGSVGRTRYVPSLSGGLLGQPLARGEQAAADQQHRVRSVEVKHLGHALQRHAAGGHRHAGRMPSHAARACSASRRQVSGV